MGLFVRPLVWFNAEEKEGVMEMSREQPPGLGMRALGGGRRKGRKPPDPGNVLDDLHTYYIDTIILVIACDYIHMYLFPFIT